MAKAKRLAGAPVESFIVFYTDDDGDVHDFDIANSLKDAQTYGGQFVLQLNVTPSSAGIVPVFEVNVDLNKGPSVTAVQP